MSVRVAEDRIFKLMGASELSDRGENVGYLVEVSCLNACMSKGDDLIGITATSIQFAIFFA